MALRAADRRRRTALAALGVGLLVYGLAGIVLFVTVGSMIGRPLDQAVRLSGSIEDQRAAVIDSLALATDTMRQSASGVRGMETSLADARAATDRSASLSLGVAASMHQLADAMQITIFGIQPLVGLAVGFNTTGDQLELLAADIATIGQALDANREDATAVAEAMDSLAASIGRLRSAVQSGPQVDVTTDTVDSIRLIVLAVVGWLGLLAVGCIGGGALCLWLSQRRSLS
jgi:hypothetical protein